MLFCLAISLCPSSVGALDESVQKVRPAIMPLSTSKSDKLRHVHYIPCPHVQLRTSKAVTLVGFKRQRLQYGRVARARYRRIPCKLIQYG